MIQWIFIQWLLLNKNKWAINPWKPIKEHELHIGNWNKPIRKVYMVYDSNYVVSGKGKALETAKISGC